MNFELHHECNSHFCVKSDITAAENSLTLKFQQVLIPLVAQIAVKGIVPTARGYKPARIGKLALEIFT